MITLLLSIVQIVRRFYWWLVRPTTRGVRAIVVNQVGEVLLVRHTYQEGWFLPGGKNRKHENDEDALCRELREELGIGVTSTPKKLGEYINTYEYKKDTIVVFVVDAFTQKNIKHFEVEKHNFFKPGVLPERTSPGTQRRIEEWIGKRTINNKW
ncbi:MAG: NUDIX domain-containing protein [bacterium]|nr:NUDIX domain-containing protein [bacterium]